MRYVFAFVLLLIWLLIAPWIAKGYGEWHLPTPWTDTLLDFAVFYLLPLSALGIVVSTYRLKNSK